MWQKLTKNFKLLIIIYLISVPAMGQDTEQYFNAGANQYIAGNVEQARSTVMDGLRQDPNSQKLKALLEKINQQEDNQNQQNQQDQEQQNQEQESQDQQQQEQEQQQQEQQEQQSQQEQQQSDEQQEAEKSEEQQAQEQQAKQQENEEKAALDSLFNMQEQDMKISPEKARMILEALRNNEIQYYQQRRRKPTQRPDRTKPDW